MLKLNAGGQTGLSNLLLPIMKVRGEPGGHRRYQSNEKKWLYSRKSSMGGTMQTRDIRDALGGLALTGLALWATWHSLQNYSLGTLRSMGPGMFPTGVSALLAVLGMSIAIPAFFRSGQAIEADLYSAFFVLFGAASFALVVPFLGLIPAIISTVVISSLAAPAFRPLSVLVLAAVLCAMSWLIFRVGLGISMAMFRSPF